VAARSLFDGAPAGDMDSASGGLRARGRGGVRGVTGGGGVEPASVSVRAGARRVRGFGGSAPGVAASAGSAGGLRRRGGFGRSVSSIRQV